MQPISAATQDSPPSQAVPPAKPPNQIPAETLRAMVLTLPRPAADAPAAAWQEVVQGGLDKLAALGPRDSIEVMLAVPTWCPRHSAKACP